MVVANDVRHDTRVLKSALALADLGLSVTILGISSTGRREEYVHGDVRVIAIPVQHTVRGAALQRRQHRRRPRLALPVQVEGRGRLDRVGAVADRGLRHGQRLGWRAVDAALSRVAAGATWRRVLPDIADLELAFTPDVDELEWDVIHAHDVHLVGVASTAVARRLRGGGAARWIYDAHEYVAGLSLYGSRTRRVRAAFADLEREYIRDAAAVVTVTEPLAQQLQHDHRLPVRPTVVMNSPDLRPLTTGGPEVRTLLGLDSETTLLVYAGGVTAARGLDTAVEALVDLPGVHLAVVAVPSVRTSAVRRLAAHARALGVEERVHLVDPVSPEQVSAFLVGADIGLLPLRHFGSHEVALANKLFEYLHAGLPVLVSDCRAQAEFVRRHGVGRVHVAGDAESFAHEVRSLVDAGASTTPSPEAVADLLAPLAWHHQVSRLREVYATVLDVALDEPAVLTDFGELADLHQRLEGSTASASVLAIGPANMAGQAWEWARATERLLPGLRAEVLSVDRGSAVTFDADEVVPANTFARDRGWAQHRQSAAVGDWTHALLEAGRPVFGLLNGRDFRGDVEVLRAAGVEVGLVLHGSEIRNPSAHAARSPWSPFADPSDDLTRRLQKQSDRLRARVAAFVGPVFVSTPDLLLDVPQAHLLPVVVDVDRWASDAPVLTREVPVVVHAPSRAALKGSVHVEAALAPLVAEGLIDYVRLEGVAPAEVFDVVRTADFVLDQFAIGTYGVLAAEAMAAGRVVVSHVPDQVRRMHGDEPPIVEATPDDLETVVRRLLTDRDAARDVARKGVPYVRELHDGRFSAAVLRDVLGLRGS